MFFSLPVAYSLLLFNTFIGLVPAGTLAGRMRGSQRVERAGASGVQISFCGPQGLLDQVRQLMRETGVAEDRLQHELFEFR